MEYDEMTDSCPVCEMGLIRLRKSPFRSMIWALSGCDMVLIIVRNGAYCRITLRQRADGLVEMRMKKVKNEGA